VKKWRSEGVVPWKFLRSRGYQSGAAKGWCHENFWDREVIRPLAITKRAGEWLLARQMLNGLHAQTITCKMWVRNRTETYPLGMISERDSCLPPMPKQGPVRHGSLVIFTKLLGYLCEISIYETERYENFNIPFGNGKRMVLVSDREIVRPPALVNQGESAKGLAQLD
jgi:hypothetical protein